MAPVTDEMRTNMGNSPYAKSLGFNLLELSEGYAKVAVKLGPGHVNFLGMIDGGLLMSLADYAFACSGNTYGQVRVAAHFSTNFVSATTPDGELIAEGKTVHVGRMMLLTEITVTNNRGKLIARATGTGITRENTTR